MRGRVTHLSLDGLTTPLGQSQVLALSERLQSMGWDCTILSLEPDSVDESAVERLEERVLSSGIRWRHRPYRWGRIAAARNVMSMAAMVRDERDRTDLYHCRSYFGAAFPAALGIFGERPYVFDTRGYWVDEKIESGRWFQDAASRALARRVERELYRRASGVVSLTELAAADVRRGRFGRRDPEAPSICIPTCVDYRKFRLERGEAPDELVLEGPIIAYVGSLNPSYDYVTSLRLTKSILDRCPDAKFLALTSQVSEMRALVAEHAIPADRCLITSVPHDEIHRWLPWIDFGLLLLVSPNDAKRASMPTKLGEFLAAGVSPISYGGNSEVAEWVRRTGSGLALDDLSDESLARAARFVASGSPERSARVRARQVAEEHFSLDSGAERYDQLFQRILARSKHRAHR